MGATFDLSKVAGGAWRNTVIQSIKQYLDD